MKEAAKNQEFKVGSLTSSFYIYRRSEVNGKKCLSKVHLPYPYPPVLSLTRAEPPNTGSHLSHLLVSYVASFACDSQRSWLFTALQKVVTLDHWICNMRERCQH
jgi:hypothetical protein